MIRTRSRVAACAPFPLLIVLGLASAGCKHTPCGKYMRVDPRPLPAAWSAMFSPPDGAVACASPTGPSEGDFRRSYDVPAKSSSEALDKWTAAVTAKGWQKAQPTKEDFNRALDPKACMLHDHYTRAGADLVVEVSKCAKGSPGWSTVTFAPATN